MGVNFDPSVGGEVRKSRPAMVVSNDEFNLRNNRVQVVPLTTSDKRLYLFEAYVTTGGRRSKVMADVDARSQVFDCGGCGGEFA